MHFSYQTTASGALLLVKVRDNGSTRFVGEDDPSYLEWVSRGNTAEVLPYVAPIGPTLEEAKAAACEQIRAATRTYIYRFYPVEKQNNMARHEMIRASAPPPALESMYSHDDLMAMSIFIDESRTLCEAACAMVNDPGIDTPEAVAALLGQLAAQYPEVLA